MVLVAGLENLFRSFGPFHQGDDAIKTFGHGFFTINMFTRIECV